MAITRWVCLAAISLAGCSRSSEPPTEARGRIVVAVTIDWEGAAFSTEGLDAIDDLRKGLGDAPITHFVSAAYFTKAQPDPAAVENLTAAVRKGDELAVHLHAWRSLAKASNIEPKLSPSFLTGTDKLLELEGDDAGFDTDLDVYDVVALRALLRTSRHLLEQTHLPVSKSFRAGGYLATPKVLQAIHDEGFGVDSSATDPHQLHGVNDTFLAARLQGLWPKVVPATQPFPVHLPAGDLLELPIAAIADYVSAAEIVAIFEAAHARLHADPGRDVFVVLAFHQETAADFAGQVGQALAKVRERHELADELSYVTVEHAAELARSAAPPAQ